jgi:hypothetical protein
VVFVTYDLRRPDGTVLQFTVRLNLELTPRGGVSSADASVEFDCGILDPECT